VRNIELTYKAELIIAHLLISNVLSIISKAMPTSGEGNFSERTFQYREDGLRLVGSQ